MSKKLNNNNLQIKPKSGLDANINTTTTKNLAIDGELHYTTDENQLYYFNGTENRLIIDYRKAQGWAFYDDSTYTSGSPLNVNNTRAQVSIDGLGSFTEKRFLPTDTSDFWDTTNDEITPENVGDAYEVRLDFTAVAGSNADKFDIELDIGDGSSVIILDQTFEMNKGQGNIEVFAWNAPIFTLETFVANGGKFYINTTDDIDFYNFGLFIKRDFAPL